MIKNGFKEIIESKTNIMLQSFSIAKECAIELLDKKEIDDNLNYMSCYHFNLYLKMIGLVIHLIL